MRKPLPVPTCNGISPASQHLLCLQSCSGCPLQRGCTRGLPESSATICFRCRDHIPSKLLFPEACSIDCKLELEFGPLQVFCDCNRYSDNVLTVLISWTDTHLLELSLLMQSSLGEALIRRRMRQVLRSSTARLRCRLVRLFIKPCQTPTCFYLDKLHNVATNE